MPLCLCTYSARTNLNHAHSPLFNCARNSCLQYLQDSLNLSACHKPYFLNSLNLSAHSPTFPTHTTACHFTSSACHLHIIYQILWLTLAWTCATLTLVSPFLTTFNFWGPTKDVYTNQKSQICAPRKNTGPFYPLGVCINMSLFCLSCTRMYFVYIKFCF